MKTGIDGRAVRIVACALLICCSAARADDTFGTTDVGRSIARRLDSYRYEAPRDPRQFTDPNAAGVTFQLQAWPGVPWPVEISARPILGNQPRLTHGIYVSGSVVF